MSYSKDLREKVLKHIALGSTIEAASKLFSVGTSSIKRWKRNQRETGSVMGAGRPAGSYKIDEDKLKSYVNENPDALLEEISSKFEVTLSAISAALKRLNFSRKKSLHSIEKGVKTKDNFM